MRDPCGSSLILVHIRHVTFSRKSHRRREFRRCAHDGSGGVGGGGCRSFGRPFTAENNLPRYRDWKWRVGRGEEARLRAESTTSTSTEKHSRPARVYRGLCFTRCAHPITTVSPYFRNDFVIRSSIHVRRPLLNSCNCAAACSSLVRLRGRYRHSLFTRWRCCILSDQPRSGYCRII